MCMCLCLEPKKRVVPSAVYKYPYTQGVVLSHSNVCATMAGLVDAGDFTNKDVYLAYLPLAHIMVRPPGIWRYLLTVSLETSPTILRPKCGLLYDVCENPRIYFYFILLYIQSARVRVAPLRHGDGGRDGDDGHGCSHRIRLTPDPHRHRVETRQGTEG